VLIPAFVTGHESIHSWECHDGIALATGDPQEVDAQGYLARIWYQVVP